MFAVLGLYGCGHRGSREWRFTTEPGVTNNITEFFTDGRLDGLKLSTGPRPGDAHGPGPQACEWRSPWASGRRFLRLGRWSRLWWSSLASFPGGGGPPPPSGYGGIVKPLAAHGGRLTHRAPPPYVLDLARKGTWPVSVFTAAGKKKASKVWLPGWPAGCRPTYTSPPSGQTRNVSTLQYVVGPTRYHVYDPADRDMTYTVSADPSGMSCYRHLDRRQARHLRP